MPAIRELAFPAGNSKEKFMAKSDTQLQHDVLEELEYEPCVDASEIGVTAKDGIVSLGGAVKSYAEKSAALHAAERVSGVRAVTDEMNVDLALLHQRNDEDIARAALNALDWDVRIPKGLIKVTVDQGCITLKGSVDYKFQQTAAENAVRHLTGVRGVVNLIDVKKAVANPAEVKAKIENALRRAAELDAQRIKVEVHGDKVILRGKIGSWAERCEAQRAAWNAPGVAAVEDNLNMEW
jgi:osmotically-inducible protein OsmY